MEEKILIEGTPFNVRTFYKVVSIILASLVGLSIVFTLFDCIYTTKEYYYKSAKTWTTYADFDKEDYDKTRKKNGKTQYFYEEIDAWSTKKIDGGDYTKTRSVTKFTADAFLIEGILTVAVGGASWLLLFLFYRLWLKLKLVITDKRVYGYTTFGRRVDLPMDSITAIGINLFKTIIISTPSGSIRFSFIKNRDEMYEMLGQQLIARQSKV